MISIRPFPIGGLSIFRGLSFLTHSIYMRMSFIMFTLCPCLLR
nr:MAG TPA: hypothetical protein [Caudoviricetes sp.]